MKAKPNKVQTIVIPELEEAARIYKPMRLWSEKDNAILRKYYNRVPTSRLGGYLKRSVTSMQQHAVVIGITTEKKGAK
jgi:hypothetical protein